MEWIFTRAFLSFLFFLRVQVPVFQLPRRARHGAAAQLELSDLDGDTFQGRGRPSWRLSLRQSLQPAHDDARPNRVYDAVHGRDLHSSTFQLIVSRFCHCINHHIPSKVLWLSRKVDECKPLVHGPEQPVRHRRGDVRGGRGRGRGEVLSRERLRRGVPVRVPRGGTAALPAAPAALPASVYSCCTGFEPGVSQLPHAPGAAVGRVGRGRGDGVERWRGACLLVHDHRR